MAVEKVEGEIASLETTSPEMKIENSDFVNVGEQNMAVDVAENGMCPWETLPPVIMMENPGSYPVADFTPWKGKTFPVYCISCESYLDVFLQLQGDETNQILDLTIDYVDSQGAAERLPIPRSVGSPCLALFDDGLWYRAKIVSDLGSGIYEVYFVDYGNTIQLTEDKVMGCPDFLVSYVEGITKVALNGFTGDETEDEISVLRTLMENKNFIARIDCISFEIKGKTRMLLSLFDFETRASFKTELEKALMLKRFVQRVMPEESESIMSEQVLSEKLPESKCDTRHSSGGSGDGQEKIGEPVVTIAVDMSGAISSELQLNTAEALGSVSKTAWLPEDEISKICQSPTVLQSSANYGSFTDVGNDHIRVSVKDHPGTSLANCDSETSSASGHSDTSLANNDVDAALKLTVTVTTLPVNESKVPASEPTVFEPLVEDSLDGRLVAPSTTVLPVPTVTSSVNDKLQTKVEQLEKILLEKETLWHSERIHLQESIRSAESVCEMQIKNLRAHLASSATVLSEEKSGLEQKLKATEAELSQAKNEYEILRMENMKLSKGMTELIVKKEQEAEKVVFEVKKEQMARFNKSLSEEKIKFDEKIASLEEAHKREVVELDQLRHDNAHLSSTCEKLMNSIAEEKNSAETLEIQFATLQTRITVLNDESNTLKEQLELVRKENEHLKAQLEQLQGTPMSDSGGQHERKISQEAVHGPRSSSSFSELVSPKSDHGFRIVSPDSSDRMTKENHVIRMMGETIQALLSLYTEQPRTYKEEIVGKDDGKESPNFMGESYGYPME